MRTLVKLAVNLVVIALLALVVGGWYYSNQLLPAVSDDEQPATIEVVAADDDTLRLRPDSAPEWAVADLHSDLVLGFDTPDGYVRLDREVGAIDGEVVTRAGSVVAGAMPAVGDVGSLDPYAWPAEPDATGVPATEVSAPGPLGDLPGWEYHGTGDAADDWVVYVHGRGGSRAEAFRTLPTVVADLGHSALSVTYRNDSGAPASPDGFGHYGDTEWEDLQAWLDWLAANREVETVTFYGFSQGGSVVAACLRRCIGIEVVSGVVLDSPLLSMDATLRLQARERGIPGPIVGPLVVATKAVADLRGGPDFANLEHVDALAAMDLPILAFAGTADRSVPPGPTIALGEADPEQVRVVTYDGDHVRGWNVDPSTYEGEVIDFLTR